MFLYSTKSSQLSLLNMNTWYFNKRMFFTREPGSYLPESAGVCEKIREQILNNDNTLEEVINKVYNENESFSTDYFTFSVSNSYISNKGYDNKVITDTNTSFVIVKLNVGNKNEARKLNTGKLIILKSRKSTT